MVDLLEGIFGMIFVLVLVVLYLGFVGGMMLLLLKFLAEWFRDDWDDDE